jgi:hypothetical protein
MKQEDRRMMYLAGPYSHKDESIRQARFEALTKKAAQLMRDGHVIFSPITHGHAIAELHDLPLEFEWWSNQCLTILKSARGLLVLCIDGYKESIGVNSEIEYAKANNIPVKYVNP